MYQGDSLGIRKQDNPFHQASEQMTKMPQTAVSSPKPAQGRKEFFRADQIVVGLQYRQLVITELEKLDADPRQISLSRNLGLALVELNASAALAGLESRGEQWVTTAIAEGMEAGKAVGDQPAYEPSSLDLVVRGLRASFHHQYMGWAPSFGKNRIVGQVSGSYVIDGGGDGAPVAVSGNYLVGGNSPAYVIDGGGDGAPVAVSGGYVVGGNSPAYAANNAGPVVVPARGRKPGRGALVGLVDTPLGEHPWLTGGFIAAAADMLPAHSTAPVPWAAGHATFIAGLLLRQAPAAVVMLHSALGVDGTADSWSVAQAISELAQSGAQVINLSLGCYTDDGQPPLVLEAALASLGPETVVVAAAGNHGEAVDGNRPVWPAAFEDVIAVGALDNGGDRAKFTPDAKWLDALANGVGVVSTYLCGPVLDVQKEDGASGFASWSGTSFAAAAVSGAIASRIKPGRRSARQAWQELQQEAEVSGGLPVVKLRSLGQPWDVSP